jgi:hypothetical protein
LRHCPARALMSLFSQGSASSYDSYHRRPVKEGFR